MVNSKNPDDVKPKRGSLPKLVHTSEEPNARSIVDSLADGEIIESNQIENAIDAVRDLLVRDALFAKARRKIQSGQEPSSGLEQEAKEAADRLRINLREVLLLNKAFQTIVPMLFSTTDTMLQAAKRLRKCRAAQRKASSVRYRARNRRHSINTVSGDSHEVHQ